MNLELDHGARFLLGGARTLTARDGRGYSLAPVYEFSIQIKAQGECQAYTSENCQTEPTDTGMRYSHPLFDVRVDFYPDGSAVRKRITVLAHSALTLEYAITEFSRCSRALDRGGEGQPIFAQNAGFVSSVSPAALNRIADDQTVIIEQAPYVSLEAGQEFALDDVVYGVVLDARVEDTFLAYLRGKRGDLRGLRVYCDWGAHDETAGEFPLSESFALRLLNELEQGQKAGVKFDYYLMDAYWYQMDEPYLCFAREHWPQGPGRFLEKLKALGMKFGLWFDVNFGQVRMDKSKLCLSGDGPELCLAVKENADLLFSGIRAQLTATGASMIKLDFAKFLCADQGHPHTPGGVFSKGPSVRALIQGIEALRRDFPALIVLGYNTFTTFMNSVGYIEDGARRDIVSPWWSLYMDYTYCGDPRPGERPAARMEDSIAHYSDCMTRRFLDALMPPEAIDDHGTMLGETNTIYYLGKACLRDTWVLNMARGGGKQHLYGELALLSQDDWAFLAGSEEFFALTCRKDLALETLGNLFHGLPHAYVGASAGGGYIAVINPGLSARPVHFAPACWGAQETLRLRKIYSNGQWTQGECLSIQGAFSGELAAGDVEIYLWERAAQMPKEGVVIIDANTRVRLNVPGKPCELYIRLAEEDGKPLRALGRAQEAFRLTGNFVRRHTQMIWSGMSWMAYSADGAESPVLVNDLPRRIRVYWRAV